MTDYKDIEDELAPFVGIFSSGLVPYMSHEVFKSMRDALMALCVVCYTKGKLAAVKETNKVAT